MRPVTAGLAALAIAALGCGKDGESARTNAREAATEEARAYFKAFRAGDIDRACAHVARRMLSTTMLVGTNISPTREGVRRFGGDWPKGQFDPP